MVISTNANKKNLKKSGTKVTLEMWKYCPWSESTDEREGFTLFCLPRKEQTVVQGVSSDTVQATAQLRLSWDESARILKLWTVQLCVGILRQFLK